jgi:hypothetical protein
MVRGSGLFENPINETHKSNTAEINFFIVGLYAAGGPRPRQRIAKLAEFEVNQEPMT